jgi:hypothetical protein
MFSASKSDSAVRKWLSNDPRGDHVLFEKPAPHLPGEKWGRGIQKET